VVSLFQEEYREDAIHVLKNDVENRPWNLNIEYRQGNVPYATLVDASNNDGDVAKGLIREGYLMLENRREKKLQKLVRRLLKHFTLNHVINGVTVLYLPTNVKVARSKSAAIRFIVTVCSDETDFYVITVKCYMCWLMIKPS
jgi:hypothetical protein